MLVFEKLEQFQLFETEKSELTELFRERDASCPKGKKVGVIRIRTIGIFMCKGETNETTCDRYTKRNNR